MTKYTIEAPDQAPEKPAKSRYTLEHPDDTAPAAPTEKAIVQPVHDLTEPFKQGWSSLKAHYKEATTPDKPSLAGLIPGVSRGDRATMGALGDALGLGASALGGEVFNAVESPVARALSRIPGAKKAELKDGHVQFKDMTPEEREAKARMALDEGLMAVPFHEGMTPEQIRRAQAGAEDRARLVRNVETMDRLGVAPSAAVAHPGRNVRQGSQFMGQNLAIGQPVRSAVRRAEHGVAEHAEEAARRVGTPRSPTEAGRIVKRGVERFMEGSTPQERAARAASSPATQAAGLSAARRLKSRDIGFGRKADVLYENVGRMIGGGGQTIQMPDTMAALNDIRYRYTGAMTGFREPQMLTDLAERLDAQGGTLTFDDARALRTDVRNMLRAEPSLKREVREAEVDSLYDAMTRDLRTGATSLGGREARRAMEQADTYYRTGKERQQRALDQAFGTDEPAKVFYDLVGDAREGRGLDLDRLMQVRRSLRPGEWRDVATSILDEMVRSQAGKRTEESPTSFRTFLTNFNKLAGNEEHLRPLGHGDSGLRVLFEGAGFGDTYEYLHDIARVAGMLRESEKFYNFSGSGTQISNMGTAAAAATALAHHEPFSAMLGLISGNAVSAVLGSPSVARFLAQMARNQDATLAEELDRLARGARRDPELADFARMVLPAAGAGDLLAHHGVQEEPEPEPAESGVP